MTIFRNEITVEFSAFYPHVEGFFSVFFVNESNIFTLPSSHASRNVPT